jgi:hypothetical protein
LLREPAPTDGMFISRNRLTNNLAINFMRSPQT